MTLSETSLLADLWKKARQSGKESAWRNLLDEAHELLRQTGVCPEDLVFLCSLTLSASPEAIAGVRLLACLSEESLIHLITVRALLLQFLKHKEAAVRIAVVEGFWQSADRNVAPDLILALAEESHPEVRATIEHVLRLFGAKRP